MRARPDELRADFQRYYGIDSADIGASVSPLRAAALAAHLPRESATARAESPDCAWGDIEWMLHSIEFSLRVIAWHGTEDGAKGRREPKPLPTPADRARVEKKLESTDVCAVMEVLEKAGVMPHGR